jgi:Fe-Mn family superoxide dismutase
MTRQQPSAWTQLQHAARQINRRGFLGAVGLGSVAAMFGPGISAARPRRIPARIILEPMTAPTDGKFTLPPLPYNYDALEPHIDTFTMQLHHDRHHNTYVNNLNAALENYPDLRAKNATELISNLAALPAAIQTAVRNNGGGHVNHSIFWAIMGPNGGGEPTGGLANAINGAFGSFASFKQQFNAAGEGRFGSGWAWLVIDGAGALQIISTPNQDSPYMQGLTPLLGNDVWEHSYYLRYQNRRAEYLNAWWNVVNWDAVAQRYNGVRG